MTTSSSSSTGHHRPSGQITRVAIRDGKTIAINDYIYVSTPYSPGIGEPYLIARVMEFITASSSRAGSAPMASKGGTLQVRANFFLRTRDISHRMSADSRLLVATMHSDVFSLDNVRGLCEVRHRELIGDAPEVSAWKKRDDHFYYHQFYDRYIHRFYDVVPTTKLQNAPAEVLDLLRKRYSFILAEPGISADLCDGLRGCTVCYQWASGPESVRCDTCKKFFHMRCLNPPLTSKPAKGYSWTCAPCTRRHEQAVALEMGSSIPSSSASSSQGSEGLAMGNGAIRPLTATTLSGRPLSNASAQSRPKGAANRRHLDGEASKDNTPHGSPAPEKTLDDIRGVRCTNQWPYRYFGQYTHAPDVLDPHDSIYPRATTRIGVKYQVGLPTWDEQKSIGLGVIVGVEPEGQEEAEKAATAAERAAANRGKAKGRGRGRGGWGGARTRGGEDPARAAIDKSTPGAVASDTSTPIGTPKLGAITLPVPDGSTISRDSVTPAAPDGPSSTTATIIPAETVREFERGTDESVEVISDLCRLGEDDPQGKVKFLEAYLASTAFHFKPLPLYNVDFIDRAMRVYSNPNTEPIQALAEVSSSTAEHFRIVHWSQKERRAFDAGVREYGCELRQLRKLIPTKKPSDIVRYFAVWKTERLKEQHAAEKLAIEKASEKGKTAVAASPSGMDATLQGPSSTSSLRPDSTNRAVSPALSLYDDDTVRKTPSVSCKMCSTSSAPFWYKGPWAWTNRFLCDYCGLYWRKYAAESSPTDLIATNPRKHAMAPSSDTPAGLGVAPPIKVSKTSRAGDVKSGSAAMVPSSSTESTVIAAPVLEKPDPIKCVLCRRMDPKKKLQQCRKCSLSVHQGCFGLSDEETAQDIWFCEACTNEKKLDAALVPKCVLCPSVRKTKTTTPANAAAASTTVEPLTALDAFKPTECNNWIHLICSVFMPDLLFADAVRFQPVEGAGHLPLWRYHATCEICNTSNSGACLTCSDSSCKKAFHISCAFERSPRDYEFGFEIHPVKMTRRDAVDMAAFKQESGHWSALVYCKSHKESMKERGQIYDFNEVDPKTGLTALQTYVRSHKSVQTSSTPAASATAPAPAPSSTPTSGKDASAANANTSVTSSAADQTYALLRRAKRLDQVLAENEQERRKQMMAGASSQTESNPTPSPHPPTANGSSTKHTSATPSPAQQRIATTSGHTASNAIVIDDGPSTASKLKALPSLRTGIIAQNILGIAPSTSGGNAGAWRPALSPPQAYAPKQSNGSGDINGSAGLAPAISPPRRVANDGSSSAAKRPRPNESNGAPITSNQPTPFLYHSIATSPSTNGSANVTKPAPTPKQCLRCSSRFSPFWWDVPAGTEVKQSFGEEKTVRSTGPMAKVCNACRAKVLPAVQE